MFVIIDLRGGEKTVKLSKKLVFALIISILLLFSAGCVFAGDNETVSDVMSVPVESDSGDISNVETVLDIPSDEGLLEANNNVINVHVTDSYNETSKTWDEDGFDLAGATVKVYNSKNKLIKTQTTDSKGNVVINNLGSEKYNLEISYSTYEPIKLSDIDFTKKSGTVKIDDVMFVPDILLLVDYNSHNEKVDLLMNMSKRVAFISTTDFDKSRAWLVEYANYIHIDMFSESAYSVLTGQYLKELLARSPANTNYKVAYTFSVFSQQILNNTGMHIIGASAKNNTYDTIENTYIGSYFQARDIEESDILQSNMRNYLDYVRHLINPSKYANPTLDENNAPLMSPECGFYHPDLGMYTLVPEGKLINQWIRQNPGYTHSSDGSLNWMTENYVEWLTEVLDPTALFKKFESDYIAKFNPEKSFIAIASYYGGEEVSDALIRGYEAQGRPAFNVFKTGTQPPMSSILNKIKSISTVGISAINSLCSWSLDYANGTAEPDLTDIDLHVLKGIVEISEYSYKSELGLQVEWTYMVTYPSFEGVFGQVALSWVDSLGKSHVIQDGVDKMVQLNCKWADLHDLNNSDKKIAVMLYNYPPGKAEIGASYLDVFSSAYDLLLQLYSQGYDIGGDVKYLNYYNNTYEWIIETEGEGYNINGTLNRFISLYNLTQIIFDMNNKGSWASGLLEKYVEDNWDYLMEHHQLISLEDFEHLTSDIRDELYNDLISYWGDNLGPAMVYKQKYIVIPGVWFGNVFITFQPSRGWEEVQDYHSLVIPPHQQYVAFYKWMEKTAKMNAIVSMGTHGTLEWLPGTNLGAFPGDWTFELTLIPTVYPYIVSNPGEAMVARDRSSALLLTHMTPAMVSSELYGNYTTLKNYINYYKEQMSLNVTSNAESYKNMILELAPALGFKNLSSNESFSDWLDDLHHYLDAMEEDFNTYGLHTLGKILTGYELAEEVITIVTSQTKIYNQLIEFLYPDLADLSFYDDMQGNFKYADEVDAIKAFLKNYAYSLVNGSSAKDLNKEFGIKEGTALYNSTLYCEDVISYIEMNNEWNAILLALNGSYVKSGLFADPSYGDSIPTGYDGYASDPTRMPSLAAYESAVKIVNMLLANYYEEHGQWPELTSLILWGTEISRTEGIGVAEFMYLLGCKPVWADNGKVLGVEQIPLEELTVELNNGTVVNRPRIDVFASMVTNNKDWITWMLTAVNMAVNATGEDASNNYVIKHYEENPTLDRLFGLPGNVLEGTGMSNLIPNTADWSIDSVNQYAMDIYLSKVSYSWTLDEKGNIVVTNQKENYKYLLEKVDVITQNFDSTWRLFDSDDYYDWFGGLYNAANVLKNQSGKPKPDTAFFDIRNKNKYVSRTYQEEIEFEIRSILLNPQYYEALVNTPGGMNAYASRFQNFYASNVLGGEKLNTELGNQLADTVLKINSGVTNAQLSAGSQSSMAWMIYMSQQGIWDGDASTVQKLVDAYMQSVIDYGVACCHHTCKNLAWNAEIIQLSSLTPAQKQKFAEILAQATNTDPLYQQEQQQQNGQQGNSGNSNGNSNNGNQNANALVNNTSQQQSDGSDSGGRTAFGVEPSESGDAKSATQSQSAQDPSSGESGAGGAKSYELSEKSASKSASSTESNMPAFVIVAVLALIAIFLVGYLRDNNDEDDY